MTHISGARRGHALHGEAEYYGREMHFFATDTSPLTIMMIGLLGISALGEGSARGTVHIMNTTASVEFIDLQTQAD